jgi:DNA-binding NtrC family response regulator
MVHRLLLIQPQKTIRTDLRELLGEDREFCYEYDHWDSLAFERLDQSSAHLVVAAAVPLVPKSIEFFRWLLTHSVSTPILAVLPDALEADILETVSKVTDDFILWPIRKEELRQRVRRVLGTESEFETVHNCLNQEFGLIQLIGADPKFVHVIEKIPLLARSEASVVITGETGTGKELFARAIHHLSCRRGSPFIPVDCSAIPDHLFENELFGHVRGAYTDAQTDQKGLVAIADGGTLFLDEIDTLSLRVQAKLLRFLQEHTYKPLGSERFLRAEVNVCAASNSDLESRVRDKEFRSDLYFRLNVLRLQLPPLRERRGDVQLLACHFLGLLTTSSGKARKLFSESALYKLTLYYWLLNVRELFNVVQRAVVLCEGHQILPCHISLHTTVSVPQASRENFQRAKARAIGAFEQEYIEELLRKHRGNITQASRDAGKDRRAFGRLVKKYQIAKSP